MAKLYYRVLGLPRPDFQRLFAQRMVNILQSRDRNVGNIRMVGSKSRHSKIAERPMKIAGNILLMNTTDRLRIQWGELPFNLCISVLWQGQYFTVRITCRKTEFGRTKTFQIGFQGKQYAYKWTNYKYMAGHHGDRFPVIETPTHALKFVAGEDSLVMINTSKDQAEVNYPGDNSFTVFYQS